MTKKNRHLEYLMQCAVVENYRWRFKEHSELITLPSLGINIGAVKMKQLINMGLTPGYPDIFIPLPSNSSHGLFIEFKVEGGRLQSNQKAIIEKLQQREYTVDIVSSYDEAIEAINCHIDDI